MDIFWNNTIIMTTTTTTAAAAEGVVVQGYKYRISSNKRRGVY